MKRFEILFMVLQLPLDFLLLLLAGGSAYSLRFSDWAVSYKPVLFSLSLTEYMLQVGAAALLWVIIFALTGLYTPDPNRRFARDVRRILLSSFVAIAVIAMYILFTQQLFESRFLIAVSWVLALIYIILGRLTVRGIKGLYYRAGMGLRQVVVIGEGSVAEQLVETLETRPELGYSVTETFSDWNAQVKKKIQSLSLDEIILASPQVSSKKNVDILRFSQRKHIGFKYSADMFATLSANMRIHPLAGMPMVELKRTPLDGWGRVAKRIFDVVMSSFLLVILSPILLLCSLGVLLETGRPIFYKNERVGIRGSRFFLYKFRSMYQKDSTGPQFGEAGKKAEEKEKELIKKQNSKEGPIYKVANDPRVTTLGRFLRRWSLDELPQFFNVIKGEMSIVGPRPHQPREVAHYEDDYPIVFDIKPGVTGLSQISGRSDLSFEEEMRLDALYIERWSVWLDIIVFVKTPFVLVKKRKVE